jgi:hypothetical protein
LRSASSPDAPGDGRGHVVGGVGVVVPLVAGKAEGGQGVCGQVVDGEVLRAVQVDRRCGRSEGGQQVADAVVAARAHHDLDPDVGAGLDQR